MKCLFSGITFSLKPLDIMLLPDTSYMWWGPEKTEGNGAECVLNLKISLLKARAFRLYSVLQTAWKELTLIY